MKRIFFAILAAALLAAPNPGTCEASPDIRITKDVKTDCRGVSEHACYVPKTQTIYISAYVKPETVEFLFLHEYGHHLTWHVPEARLRAVFGGKDQHETLEKAANGLYFYVVFNASQPKEKIEFWQSILNPQKYARK